MMRFGRFAFITLPSLTVLCVPGAARAQRFGAVAVGTNVAQGPALQFQSLSAGFAGQASMGYRVTPRLRVRFDALFSHFRAVQAPMSGLAFPTCLSCGGPSSPAVTPTGPVGVAALTVNELIDVFPPAEAGPGAYLIAGEVRTICFRIQQRLQWCASGCRVGRDSS